jgi:hypothetical protein
MPGYRCAVNMHLTALRDFYVWRGLDGGLPRCWPSSAPVGELAGGR